MVESGESGPGGAAAVGGARAAPALAEAGSAGGSGPERTPAGAVTEVRVHGVSGTPPSSLLQDPWVVRVAGDDLSGFYRRGQATVAMMRPGPTVPEAYSWGNLTSGASARALWLLLLPFTLVNLAYWMRPTRRCSGDRASRWLARLLALSLTITLVLAAAGIGVDLIGWQCTAPDQACATGRSWLRWLTQPPLSEPGRRLLAGALIPALAIVLLWLMGRRTWKSYETVAPPKTSPVPPPPDNDYGELPMADPTFWRGGDLVPRLQGIHLGAGIAAVAIVLTWPALVADRAAGSTTSAVLGWILLGLEALLVGAAVLLLRLHKVIDRRTSADERVSKLGTWLPPVAIGVGALAAVYLAGPARPRWPETPTLPGYATLITGLFTAQVCLLLAMTSVIAWQRSRRRRRDSRWPDHPGFGGFAMPVVAAIGLLLACAFSAGIMYRIADFLDGGQEPGEGGAAALLLPPSFGWASLGFAALVLGLVVFALAVALDVARGAGTARKAYEKEVRAREQVEPTLPPAEEARLRRIARLRQLAALPDKIPARLIWLVIPGALLAVGTTVLLLATGDGPQAFAERQLPGLAGSVGFVTGLGTWLIGAFALGLVILGRAAYRTPGLRRTLGILWDVGTFWPRAGHPLAPPCYSERVVPDLSRRLGWLAKPGPDTGKVLLSAHSQGAILAAAVVMQLKREALANTRLLTYGSPLTRLYARYFPAYFTPTMLEQSRQLVGSRWRNLRRLTDPIGGWIFPDPSQPNPKVDYLLADPTSFLCADSDTVPPAPQRHSDYWTVPAYDEAVRGLLAADFTPPPPSTATTPSPAEPKLDGVHSGRT